MTLDIGITLGVIGLAVVLLVLEVLSPDVLLLAALATLLALEVVPLEEGLAGFSDPTIVAIGSLFVVASGLRSTGILRKAAELLFGGFRSLRGVLLRLVLASGVSSAFLNNTPIVAMGISSVLGWTRGKDVSASKLLIPLSYASILGGICTLIGTSTNLVADGLLREHGYPGLGFFELGLLGVPLAVTGFAYLVLVAPRFLPDQAELDPELGPHPEDEESAEAGGELREVVIPEGSILTDDTVEHADFPGRYGATVISIIRHGAEMDEDPEKVILHRGDTLFLAGSPGFGDVFQEEREFLMVGREMVGKELDEESLWQPSAAKVGLLILALVVALATTGIMHISVAGLLGAVAMVAMKLVTPAEARKAVDWSVLIVIGAAIGLGHALEVTGAAVWLGKGIVALGAPLGAMGILAAALLACMFFTLTITNTAAVALIFPVVLSAATSQGLDPRPFIIAITVGASLAFATPLGYQTNIMVYGPGGYRFSDFVRVGLPLQLLLAVLSLFLIPFIWPLG
ncbi:MAG: SLC13 family permease [Gemmatimonadota bacterium]